MVLPSATDRTRPRAEHLPIDGKKIYLRLLRQVWPYRGIFVFSILAMLVLGITEDGARMRVTRAESELVKAFRRLHGESLP